MDSSTREPWSRFRIPKHVPQSEQCHIENEILAELLSATHHSGDPAGVVFGFRGQ
jgi:hypothetical protein